MAYEVKYRGEFSDNEGTDWKVEILEDGFSGTVTTMQMTGNPLDFDWPSETDNCFDQNIRGSAVSINVFCETDFAYSELFTSDNLEYKVNIYHDDTTLFWTGWIAANSWNEPYSLIPYPITISATDGLGLLKDMDFTDLSLTGRQTHSKIIHDILEDIGFDEFTEYINVYESTMDSDIDDSPLDQAGADTELWEESTMYDALKDILKMYDAAIIQYGGEMVIYRYLELDVDPQITQLLEPALIRNVEGDNVSSSSTTTLLEIGSISGTEITLTGLTSGNLDSLDALIDKSVDWFIQSLDDYNSSEPSYFGDYTVQAKVSSFNIVGEGKITVSDITGFTVGDRICLYSPWANYRFLSGQKDNGILYSASKPSWRANSEASGPVWWDDINDRYILIFAGYNGTNYQLGFAYSTDLVNWTVGNSDNPIVENSDDAHFAKTVHAIGNVIDNIDGTVSFALSGNDGSDRHIHLGTCDKDDPTTITWSANKLINSTILQSGGIVYYDGQYHMLAAQMTTPIEDRYNEHYVCDTIDGTYTKVANMWTTEYNGNDSHWLEGHSTTCMPFVENGKLYAIVGGTQRYTISGIQGNRVYGFMKYESGSWLALNEFEPSLIHPMYFYNIPSEDYGWAGGHTGGYPSFIKKDGKCYMFFAFIKTTDTYQIGAIEFNNTEHLMYGRTFTSPTAKTATTTDVAQFINRSTTASNFIEHGGTLMIAPQVKELILTQDYGAKDSILKTWEFDYEDFTGAATSWDVSDWSEAVTPDPRPLAAFSATRGENPGILLHSVRTTTGSNIRIYQEVDVLTSSADGFVLSFEYAAINVTGGSLTGTIEVEVIINESGTDYYFTGYGWSATPTRVPTSDNTLTVTADDDWSGWNTYEKRIDGSKTGTMTVNLYAMVEGSGSAIWVAYKNIKIQYTNNDGQIVESIRYNVTNAVNGQIIEKEYVLGDGDDLDNVLIMSKGAVNVYSGADEVATSRSWSTRGGGESDPIIELVGGEIGNQFSRPKHILDLEIYEQDNDFFTLLGHLQDDLNQYLGYNRKFIINRATYDVRMRKWNLSLNELI